MGTRLLAGPSIDGSEPSWPGNLSTRGAAARTQCSALIGLNGCVPHSSLSPLPGAGSSGCPGAAPPPADLHSSISHGCSAYVRAVQFMHEEWRKEARLMHSLEGWEPRAGQDEKDSQDWGKNGSLKLVRKRARQCLNFPQDVRNVKSKV